MTPNNKRTSGTELWVLLIGYISLLFLIIVFATSCSPLRRMYYFEHKHPELLLQYCASRAKIDTVRIKGKVKVDTQTVTLSCDTILKTDTLRWNTTKKIPFYTYIPDTIKILTIDTSGTALLRKDKAELTNNNNNIKGKISTWRMQAIIAYGITILLSIMIGVLIRRK